MVKPESELKIGKEGANEEEPGEVQDSLWTLVGFPCFSLAHCEVLDFVAGGCCEKGGGFGLGTLAATNHLVLFSWDHPDLPLQNFIRCCCRSW